MRVSHWGIVIAVLSNHFLLKPGGTAHVWIGWGVLALLLARLLWGLVGPRPARFSAFPPDPRGALSHLASLLRGRPAEHGSHNPAGALMAYALWACLAVVVATGLVMTGGKTPVAIAAEKAAVAAGDWSALVDESTESHDDDERQGSEWAEEIHDVAATLILFLAFLHVAGVVVESRALGRNLVRPMIAGRRQP